MIRETGELPEKTDVIVLGAGMAGHCAALVAADAGCDVLLLDKAAHAGGSSAMAGGAFAFSGTDLMAEAGHDETLEDFRTALLEAGEGRNDPVLLDTFINHQKEGYQFLRERGVSFALGPQGGRLHRTMTGAVVTKLHTAAISHPRIGYFSHSSGQALHRDAATGKVDQAEIAFGDRLVMVGASKGIVLTTGGFSRSRELLRIFRPELLTAVKHGGVANTGDGLLMAASLGAGMADIGYVAGSFGGAIGNYPHGVQGAEEVPPLLFSFQLGGILVNKAARRFVDEAQGYKALSRHVLDQPGAVAFQIFDQNVMERSNRDSSVNDFQHGLNNDYIRTANSIPELAARMDLDADALKATIDRYNADVVGGRDTQFGRQTNLSPVAREPYYIAATTNALTSTYGGITANADLAVTDWMGEPIPGLFAAGEVVGGLHGAGYYSGASLSSAVTFGMLAGRSAAAG